MRQHLLQGFGFNSNLRWIRIARNDRAIMDAAFQNQIMQTVSQIENIYWDLVNAYENVKVQQRALELADKTLSDTQKQVEIGTLAPITVVQSQSSVATAKQNLIIAQTNLQLQQLLMKNAITRNNTDPILATAPVIPTDTLQINEPFQTPPVEQLIDSALKNRPEIVQSRLNLTNREVGLKAIKNLQLPTVDLFAFYGGTGPGRAPRIPTSPAAIQRRLRANAFRRGAFLILATGMPLAICSTARRPTRESASTSTSRCETGKTRLTRCVP